MKDKQKPAGTGRTFLRSTNHLVVRETQGNLTRSILVGLQFGILYLPTSLVTVAIWPFLLSIVTSFCSLIEDIFCVLKISFQTIVIGFWGRLEASEEVTDDIEDDSYYE